MSQQTLGVGIVGFGFMGKTHSFAYKAMPFYYPPLPFQPRLVGVCVRQAKNLDPAIQLGGFEVSVTDLEQLLARPDIHIIHVCTPNHLHRQQVIAALDAGKHVYCDKPLGASYEDCLAIMAALERNQHKRLVNQVAHNWRYAPCVMRAAQLMREGFLGQVTSFRACFLHSSSVDPEKPLGWKLDKARGGGGVLYDLGAHVVDLVQWLVGPLRRVMGQTHTYIPRRKDPATGNMVEVQTDDQALLIAQSSQGAWGTIESSKIATGVNDELRVEIHGSQGALRFNLMDPSYLDVYDMRAPAAPMGGLRGFTRVETVGRYPEPALTFPAPSVSIGWLRPHIACLHNFLAAIAGQTPADPSFAQATALQRVLDAGYESARKGAWVDLPAP